MNSYGDIPWRSLLDVLDPNTALQDVFCFPDGEPLERALAWEEMFERVVRIARTNSREPDQIATQILTQLFHPARQDSSLIHRLRSARSPEKYLRRVIRNAATDEVRSRKSKREVSPSVSLLEELPDKALPPDSAAELSEDTQVLTDLLARRFRELLHRRRLRIEDFDLLSRVSSGVTISQLAQEHGVEYSAMAVRLHRAVRRYRKEFGEFTAQLPTDQGFAERLVAAMKNVAEEIQSDM